MSLNSYLKTLSEIALLKDDEKENIKRSIATLKVRLNGYFGELIEDQFVFGSYSRKTILPRYMDEHSDVDYIVVFKDSKNDPQTYLNRLRAFVESRYSSSEVFQSRPTIVLMLSHIKFDLVPAISNSFIRQLQIPGKASAYTKWVDTNPKDFNEEIIKINESHQYFIKTSS